MFADFMLQFIVATDARVEFTTEERVVGGQVVSVKVFKAQEKKSKLPTVNCKASRQSRLSGGKRNG
jgi:hypothetical protein